MALYPSAIAILPSCASGVLVSAGGLDWLDVVAEFVEVGFVVDDGTERPKLTLTEVGLVVAVWVLKPLEDCGDTAFGFVLAVADDVDNGRL
jgi:hypothetical protein